MIPKEIILNNLMNEKRVMLYSYFATKRGLDDTVGFSCDTVVEWCGFKHNYHKNKINDQIADLIYKLVEYEYIEVNEKIFRNNCNIANLKHEKFDIDNQFALIYFDEINNIRNFKYYTKDTNKMNSAILLLVLSYLRVNMLRRQNGYLGKESDKPEFCYRMYIDIEKDLGISSRYISRAVKILNEMDIIVSEGMPRYKDKNDNWHTDVTLFVNKYKRENGGESLDSKYDYKQELQWGVQYIDCKKLTNISS